MLLISTESFLPTGILGLVQFDDLHRPCLHGTILKRPLPQLTVCIQHVNWNYATTCISEVTNCGNPKHDLERRKYKKHKTQCFFTSSSHQICNLFLRISWQAAAKSLGLLEKEKKNMPPRDKQW